MKDQRDLEPLLVKPAEAARLISLSERNLWGRTASGEIRCIRIGRSVRYRVDDLKAWIESQQEPQAAN